MTYFILKNIRAFLVALFVLSVFATPSYAFDLQTTPSLSLISGADVQAAVAANKGKVIVLNFFASWCPPCREEIPDIINIRAQYAKDDVLILGLSIDQRAVDLQRFAQRIGFTYPVFQVKDDIIEQYAFSSIPYNVVISRTGKTIYAAPGMLDEKQLTQLLQQGGL